jgi:hypothetical protein
MSIITYICRLNAKIEALDFDVEKAAEDELTRVGGSVHNADSTELEVETCTLHLS